MFAFASHAPELRTYESGVFSLLRQLGCACGVALMTAVLRLEVNAHGGALAAGSGAADGTAAPLFDLPTLLAYSDCFRMMAWAALVIIPGIFLFRPTGLATDRTDGAPTA